MKAIIVVTVTLLAIVAIVSWILTQRSREGKRNSYVKFLMPIDDVFALETANKVVVVGVIATGHVQSGDSLQIQTGNKHILVKVEALEAFHRPLKTAKAGDRVGIMVQGVDKADVVLPAALVSAEAAT